MSKRKKKCKEEGRMEFGKKEGRERNQKRRKRRRNERKGREGGRKNLMFSPDFISHLVAPEMFFPGEEPMNEHLLCVGRRKERRWVDLGRDSPSLEKGLVFYSCGKSTGVSSLPPTPPWATKKMPKLPATPHGGVPEGKLFLNFPGGH